jgi:hypothetical protein
MSKKLLTNSKFILACAGSGKTTFIVEEALKAKEQKVLITTYTNENLDQIKRYLIEKNGCIPANICPISWYSFLLKEGVRPYQNHLCDQKRIRSIFFLPANRRFQKKNDYITSLNDIYSNKTAEFVYECNKQNNGLILRRLEKIYSHIYIDELQDFAGYDLNLLEVLFNSSINVITVGDPRQATFTTNNALKNKQYRKSNIYLWMEKMNKDYGIPIEEKNESHRCNQEICDFADSLFPDMPKTTSKNSYLTGHDGVFFISRSEVKDYITKYNPMKLRYNIRTNTLDFAASNIGLVKGRTYDRVLIFPTKPMLEYFKTKNLSKVGDKSKLYVGITRARYSVVFITD